MTEPDTRAPADAEPSEPTEEALAQLAILDKYEHQRRTWELELLISGAVVFAMLGVPGILDDWVSKLMVHVSRNQFLIVFLGYAYLKLIAYALILSFCTNLAVRGYWIGLIGLHKVFPEGVRWSELKDGPITLEIHRRQPDLPRLIGGADRFASMIFSAAFFVVIIFVFSIILFTPIAPAAWIISSRLYDGEYLWQILYALLAVFFVPPLLCTLFDRKLREKPREEWEHRWYVKPMRAVLAAFHAVTLRPLYSTIQLTLMSNTPKRITYPLYYLAMVVFMGYLFISTMFLVSGKLPLNDYRLFPDVGVERGVDYRHYESLQPPGEILRNSPSIQSDILRDPFIRLFIPYSPRYNPDLAELCPDVKPIPKEGFFGEANPSEETVGSALDCLGSYHLVFLNGERLEPQYDFFTRADTGVRGIVAYIPTEGLPKGRNALRIERVQVDEEEDEEDKTEYFIPFWL